MPLTTETKSGVVFHESRVPVVDLSRAFFQGFSPGTPVCIPLENQHNVCKKMYVTVYEK